MNISRRSFLKGMAAGAVGLAASSVIPAQKTAAAEEQAAPAWSDKVTRVVDTDYVIVGSGMAGMVSAVRAAELGMKVVVLEKMGLLGGSSNIVEGTFGLGTSLQKAAGVNVPSVGQLMQETLEYHHYNCNAAVVRRFYEHSPEDFEWMLEEGVPLEFFSFGVEGMNPTRHAFAGESKRGADAIKVFKQKAESLGVTISMNTEAKEVIMKDGKACGVYAVCGEEVLQVNAKAVMLATGGYAGNPDMLVKYAKIANRDFVKDCGMTGRTGDGINMALAAGGTEWRHMGVLQNFGPITKNDSYATHLYAASAASGFRFNEKGERYANEELDVLNFAFSGNIMQQQKASFSIASKADMEKWATEAGPYGGGFFMVGLVPLTKLWEQVERDMASDDPQVFYCETLEDVAKTAGVDAATLKASVARYDQMCANGVDEDYMKSTAALMPVGEGPYYLFKHCIGIFTTCDGVSVNEYAQVLDADGEPIEGLFAGGMDAGGLMGDAYDVSVASCSTQGWCVYCGRTAAQYIADHLI